MIDQNNIEHHVQKYIMSVLMHQKYARFRDMRPPKTDSNLYSYHLNLLMRRQFIQKTDQGYTLAKKGLMYVDRVTTASLNMRTRPKIITMLVIQNSDGDVLLYRRRRQPYQDAYTLPYGKVHVEDQSVLGAAQREGQEKLGVPIGTLGLEHAGDCYIRVVEENGEIIMGTLAHVFRAETDNIIPNDRLVWARPHKLSQYDLAPAVQEIVARTFFRDPFFFEEYTVPF